MDIIIQKIADNILTIIVLIALCYGLSQSRRVTNDVINHIYKIGDNVTAKELLAHRLVFNFYLILFLIIIVSGYTLHLIEFWVTVISGLVDLIYLFFRLFWGERKILKNSN